ncbi:hypothetical protein SLEP1_g23543 [Rubroshorea leprosula]|uniref:Uncharacterized protein n=1 Tax=Rubroshorea leprosula TaxID=152421 RepID=A0AAV5JJY8_9ROSI|nr:hypothetical protein SLEP1_g23543 [Rubroshorea leprosula]
MGTGRHSLAPRGLVDIPSSKEPKRLVQWNPGTSSFEPSDWVPLNLVTGFKRTRAWVPSNLVLGFLGTPMLGFKRTRAWVPTILVLQYILLFPPFLLRFLCFSIFYLGF